MGIVQVHIISKIDTNLDFSTLHSEKIQLYGEQTKQETLTKIMNDILCILGFS